MNLYQELFFRALNLPRRRRTIACLHALRRSQYWTPDELARWQLARLNELVLQARGHSPYYRRVLADVALPLRSVDELALLPTLTKQTGRSEYRSIPTRNLPSARFVPSRTGGSTGEPLHFFWDRCGQDWNRASVYLSAEWAGVALGQRTIEMSGSHFDYTCAQSAKARLAARLMRYRLYSVAYLTDELLEEYYRGLIRWRPTSIWGYASGVATFARHIAERHPHADLDFVRAVVTSSETLRPEQRELIEAVFGFGTVHDSYGSREMYMGSECHAHDGYHLHADVVMVEVVDRENRACAPGERGRILLTDLTNHAFPFIRYEVGDMGSLAEPAECACGVRMPKLATVEGRIADMVVLKDRVLTPPNFTVLMSDLRGLGGYQIRQDALDHLEVRLVPGPGYDHAVADYVRRSIERMVDGQARVDICEVTKIDVPESGKRRYIVSSVGQGRI